MIIVIILIGPCARSDWSKTHVLSESKTWKKRVFFVVVVVVVVVVVIFRMLNLYYKTNEEA